MINVRLTDETHEDFKIVCELRGVSMSGALHQFIVKSIREEKEREPQAFQTTNIKPIASSEETIREIENIGRLDDAGRKTGRKKRVS